MPSKPNRISEAEIGEATLDILANRPNGEGSMEDIKHEMPNFVKFSVEDRAPSQTRPGEEMWEQQVRNLTSHHDVPGNVICEGYAERVPGGLKLTQTGRGRVQARRR